MALESAARYRFARFELQPGERRLLADGQPVPLGPRAFDLLVALVERCGQLVTKAELLARVWGRVVVEDNALQAHISALRKALGPEAIATVSGQGYRFTLGVQPAQQAAEPAPLRQHNLPQSLTSFIGREREIAELQAQLASTRLLTLTGAGGCGKTRLALQVAGTSLDSFPGGVWLIELAPLGDESLVAATVAKALAVEAKPGEQIIDTVLAWIGSQRLLLVLDNAEHLLQACAGLADRLLRHCAQLCILATSRERLGMHGERVFRVPSLQVPGSEAAAEVLASEAARLFIARARLQRPDFEVLTGRDAEALASICKRLDGIALALELAAPRLRVMSLPALSQRLDDRFRVLTDGPRTALPRHRTLRSLIDWSHELLSGAEQAVLRRASVFAGGWTLEAAERVCAGEGVERSDVMNLLTSLADKSLVAAEVRRDETRFGMLETMRHYAHEQLRHSGEEPLAHERHLEYAIDLAGELGPTPGDARFRRALLRLDAEKGNLRAALARCQSEPARSMAGLRLAGLLHAFWIARADWEEGRAWLTRLLAVAPADGRGEVHAAALQALGKLALVSAHLRDGVAPLREAVGLWRQLGNRRMLLTALGTLGVIERQRGEFLAARERAEEALSIAREIGEVRIVSTLLCSLAQVAVRLGEHGVALALMDECVPLSRAAGPLKAAEALHTLGYAQHVAGDLEAARATLTESMQLYREAAYTGPLAWILMILAEVLQDLRELTTARAFVREALDTVPAGPQSWLGPSGLESMAGLVFDLGGATCAARLYGCAQRLHQQTGEAGWNPQRHQRLVAAARQALHDDEAFDRAWNEGLAWTLDDAIRYARSLL